MKGMMSDKAMVMRHACLRLQLFVRNRTVATEAKLSSRITISELSLATSVPWIPIESPISASFKAGASLVPSPVTATMWPFFLRHCTIRSLSNGEDLAITQIFSTLSILCSSVSEDVISSDHLDVYTSILAIFHSFLHTSSTWIFEANKPQKGQATLWYFLMYFTIFRVYLSLQCRRSENTFQESSRELLSTRVRVTAKGNPSGIATTTIVTAAAMIPTTELITSSAFVLLPLNSLFPLSSLVCPVKYRTNKTTSTRKATAKPTLPMEVVSLLSLTWRGVCSLELLLILLIISPQVVFIPTEIHRLATNALQQATHQPGFDLHFSNCLLCLKSLMAETDITRKTARKMLPPSYHPSFAPSSFMPNARDNTAHTKSMMMVGSLSISQTNWNKLFVGGLG
nr:hypothetical protein PanWU01x14_004110 [Ipomoea trifida]